MIAVAAHWKSKGLTNVVMTGGIQGLQKASPEVAISEAVGLEVHTQKSDADDLSTQEACF